MEQTTMSKSANASVPKSFAGNATRFVYGGEIKPLKAGQKALSNSIGKGFTPTGIMNGKDVEEVIEKGVNVLGTSAVNANAIIDAILTRAILTYGAERATTDVTTETTMIVMLDTGASEVNANEFLDSVFGSSVNINHLRHFSRAFPQQLAGILQETGGRLFELFGIEEPFVTYSSLFPKGFSVNHKYSSGKIKNVLGNLNSHSNDEEVVHTSIN